MAADFRNGAAREGKIQHTHFPGVRNINAEFLPDLPQHTLESRFPRLKLSSRSVHLSRANPPLLAYQENPSVLHHKHQGGENIRGPLGRPLKAAASLLHGHMLQDGREIMKKNTE